jgi:hypothetical protein
MATRLGQWLPVLVSKSVGASRAESGITTLAHPRR